MGNCKSSAAKSPTVVAHPLRTESSQGVKDFKVSQSDLVKEKKSVISDDYTFIETLGRGKSL